ncbi:MAG: hypothetical protein R3C27_04965 [Hyphomonadaceae bacterium]
MKHAKPTRAWRPVRAHAYRPSRRDARPEGAWLALIFNLCLFLLPMASAAAVMIIARDSLFAYEFNEAGVRSINARIERLNASLIQVDFDRQRQWDNMVAMELMANDPSSARGFLLSGVEMLPPRSAEILRRAARDGAGDAAIEVAALQLLLPGTRERYQSSVQLLSLRPSATPAQPTETLGDPRDFELMARALLAEPETDPLQFTLTGLSLGLAGDMSARMNAGAVVLLAAARRDEFPQALSQDVHDLFARVMPIQTFLNAAQVAAEDGGSPGDFDNASVAFAASINHETAARARALLAEIGDIAAATSPTAAATMLTHATTTTDVQRLRLLALTAGDRVAAAAKRLPRDGRLLLAARGELEFNRDLMLAVGAMALALAGLILGVLFKLFQTAHDGARRLNYADDLEEDSELLEISTNNWRPL